MNRLAETEAEVARRGEMIWKLQREREELVRLVHGGGAGYCGTAVHPRLPDVC